MVSPSAKSWRIQQDADSKELTPCLQRLQVMQEPKKVFDTYHMLSIGKLVVGEAKSRLWRHSYKEINL